IYVPTLFVGQGYRLAFSGEWRATAAEKRLADPKILAAMAEFARLSPAEHKLLAAKAQAMAKRNWSAGTGNLKKVFDAGITVALGTDAGNIGTLHGPSVFREMALMVEAGLTPHQVLAS